MSPLGFYFFPPSPYSADPGKRDCFRSKIRSEGLLFPIRLHSKNKINSNTNNAWDGWQGHGHMYVSQNIGVRKLLEHC